MLSASVWAGPVLGGALAYPCRKFSAFPACKEGQFFYQRWNAPYLWSILRLVPTKLQSQSCPLVRLCIDYTWSPTSESFLLQSSSCQLHLHRMASCIMPNIQGTDVSNSMNTKPITMSCKSKSKYSSTKTLWFKTRVVASSLWGLVSSFF